MEGVSIGASAPSGYQYYQLNAKFELNATLLRASGSKDEGDTVDTSLSQLYQGLSKTSQEIIDKINEALKGRAPKTIQELRPEEVTPEAAADRVVKGVAGLFNAFAKSNSDLSSSDLLSKFMAAVRSGVQTGYDDAFKTLKDIGAFDVNGVQSGVEKTKTLIESKLDALENDLKKRLGITPADQAAADTTSAAILSVAGGTVAQNQIRVVA